jgi:hypothetical protein
MTCTARRTRTSPAHTRRRHYPDAVYLASGSGPSASPTVIQRQEAVLTTQAGPGHPATSAAAFAAVEADLTGGDQRGPGRVHRDRPHGEYR